MILIVIGLILFAGLVGVTLLGGYLRRLIPAEQLTAESKDAVKVALGLVGTMTAILLGLLVSSAKDTFDTTRSEVIQMAAKVTLLDRVLNLYGSEAMDARRALRDTVADGVGRMWPAEQGGRARVDPNQPMGTPFMWRFSASPLAMTRNVILRLKRRILWSNSLSFGRCCRRRRFHR